MHESHFVQNEATRPNRNDNMTHEPHLKLNQLRAMSVLLDSQFRGPFGFRFGLDGIIGLVPVVGDVVTAGMSFFIVSQATLLGASPAVLTRMLLNVALENVISIIPLFGNIFDFFWKSNKMNVSLLEAHLANPRSATKKSRWFNILFLTVLLALMVASLVASFYVLQFIFHWLANVISPPPPNF